MSYNRGPYPPYDDTNSNQPYPVGYPQDLPYGEEYPPQAVQSPYEGYNYPINPYGETNYPPPGYRSESHPRRDWGDDYSREYPRPEYNEDMMNTDYRDSTSEKPRESWNERTEPEAPMPAPYKREDPRPVRRHESYRPRKPPHVDRAAPAPRNPDPYTLDHIVPFTYFCDWYRQTNARTLSKNAEVNKEELQESFVKYRDDLLARTAKGFVKEHMGEEWFKEKYDPVLGPQTRNKVITYRKWLYERFMEDMNAGQFDELTLDGAAARRYFAERGEQNASPSRKEDDDQASTTLAKMPQDPMADRPTPCIKTISTTVSRTQLEDLLEDIKGFRYLSVSDPNPMKKFARVGWVILNDPANPDEVVRLLDDQKIHDDIYGDFTVHCALHTFAKEQPRKALSELHSTRECLTRDLRFAELLATKKFEAEMGEGYNGFERIKERVKANMRSAPVTVEDEEEGAIKEDDVSESLAEIKKVLDLTVEYFRRVYSFCFFCVSENDSVHELQRKCYAGHFRRPPPDSATDLKTNYTQKVWVDKINLMINPEEADVVKLGGVNVDEAVQKEIDAAVTKEADDRWRCGVKKCTKLFLEEKFVRSHIQKRHKDWLDRINAEAQMLNRYVLDPCRIIPQSVEQPPVGFAAKYGPEKEFGGRPPYEPPPVAPTFIGVPQFSFGPGMFDAPNWGAGGYDNGVMRIDERPFRGRRGGPGGPARRGMGGGRDHPYPRREAFNERREGTDGYPIERTRIRETRSLRSYRDLDAPQEATPELNY